MVVVMGMPAIESGTMIVPLPLMAALAALIIAPASEPWKEEAAIYWAGEAANETLLDNKQRNNRPPGFIFNSLLSI
jgi:hypothetical protein